MELALFLAFASVPVALELASSLRDRRASARVG